MTRKMAQEASAAGAPSAGAIKRSLGAVPQVLWWALLELFALTGLAIAQPLLDVTGKAPDFFLLHRADRGQIVLLVAAIVLLPPVALWLLEVAARALSGERVRRQVHWAILTGLVAVLALEVGKKLLPIRGRQLLLV